MDMKEYLSVLMIAIAINLTSLQTVSCQSLESVSEINRVTTEIRLLNLINGLELDRKQIEFIIQKAEAANKLRMDLKEKISTGNTEISNALRPLQELRDTLLSDGNITKELKIRVHRANVKSLRINSKFAPFYR